MATYTLTLKEYDGTPYMVTVPKNATGQDVANAVIPQLQKKHNSKFVKVKFIVHDGRRLDPSRKLTNFGWFNPQGKFHLYLEDVSFPLRMYHKDESRKKQGAIMRAKSNQQKLINNVRTALPNDVVRYEIAEFLRGPALKGGKTRKHRKSRRQTRRRR